LKEVRESPLKKQGCRHLKQLAELFDVLLVQRLLPSKTSETMLSRSLSLAKIQNAFEMNNM
jgi:hypothetical protein